jgi:hypothetical protein
MAKTLVAPAHSGTHINGFGGCFTRWAHKGECSGIEIANWLNSLGEDSEPYGRLKTVTNGQVRQNWLRGSEHIREVHDSRQVGVAA